jgi:hypothetical protein
MKYFLLSSLLFAMVLSAQAQGAYCGLEFQDLSPKEQQAILEFYQQDRPPLAKDNNIDSVAVTVHIVRPNSSPGPNELSLDQIEAEIRKVNQLFGGAGIYFFICGSPRIIRGKASYNYDSADDLNRSEHVPNTVNIYFVDDIETDRYSNDLFIGGFATLPFYFPDTKDRYIVMNKRFSTDGSTLTHEMGHFYGLLHTHDTRFGREYVDGSNCETAGDLLCDTPADPNLLIPGLLSGCTYVGRIADPKGDLYLPPVNNLMSYAPSPCTRSFTDGQRAVIRTVHKDQNASLTGNCDFYPDFAISPSIDELTIRSDEDITIDYTFEYAGIDEPYEVELKISLAEDPNEEGLLLSTERITITPGQNTITRTFDLDFPIVKVTGVYYLQAVLDSEFRVIERTEKNNTARTTVTVDNSGLSDVLIFPNPVQEELKLFFREDRATGPFNIRIFRYDGQFLLEKPGFKGKEEFFQLIDVSTLTTGLYILTVDFENVNRQYAFKFLKR